MAAELSFAAYEAPTATQHARSEWVILSIWGRDREFLTLSRTGIRVVTDDAPPGLQPVSTHLGVLLSRVRNGREENSEYLLMRNQPADIPVGGIFHPTDGFVRLTLRDGAASVRAHGRFAHSQGTLNGQPVVHDVPAPIPGAVDARAWHLTGSRRPWIGEFAPADRAVQKQVPAPFPPVQAPQVQVPPVQRASDLLPSLVPAAPPANPQPQPPRLAPDTPAPHTRRRKKPEAKHDVTTEA